MSRSIHTNRRQVWRARRSRYADPGQQAERVRRLQRELTTKREIKRSVRSTRRGRRTYGPVAPESIPIHVHDEGEYVHYPAGADDLVAVMRRLPPGVTDGIHSITLCLGKEYQDEEYDDDLYDPDPFTDRRGDEYLPGIFGGCCLGTYVDHHAGDRITIFAYVYAPDVPDRDMWELVLRLWMLSTLMHEVAHFHHSVSNRRRRRWRGFRKARNEAVAGRLEARWVRQYVVPYLEETYPDQVKKLDAWTRHHGGVSIPLKMLAGISKTDPDGYIVRIGRHDPGSPPGSVQIVHTSDAAPVLAALAKAVAEGGDGTSTRLRFAEELHYSDLFDETLCIIDGLLEDEPGNLDALDLQADTYEHLGEHQVAEALYRRVVAADASRVFAWQRLAAECGAQCAWEQSLLAAQQGLAMMPQEMSSDNELALWYLLQWRARARLELGRYAELEEDLAALAEFDNPRPWLRLKALMLLRRQRYEEALQLVAESLSQERPWDRALLLAVRFEAARKLGRKAPASSRPGILSACASCTTMNGLTVWRRSTASARHRSFSASLGSR